MNAPTKSPGAGTAAGTVVEVHGIRATVLLHEEQRRQRCRPMRDRTPLAVGDRVSVDGSRSVPEIMSMEPRERCLWRPVERGRRIMASQVDRVIVVGAVLPEMRPGLVDRILVATDAQDIDAVLVINKVDLDPEAVIRARRAMAPYEAMGYRVLAVSAYTGEGLEALDALCEHGMSVFVGHSGVGKSSLLNYLQPGITLATGDVNEITGKGRHTTTVTTCHPRGAPWPRGGLLVDTPGIRVFGLYGLPLVDLAYGFRDLRPYRMACRFRDCLHQREPGCAVVAAVEEGAVSAERYAGYLRILASVQEGTG